MHALKAYRKEDEPIARTTESENKENKEEKVVHVAEVAEVDMTSIRSPLKPADGDTESSRGRSLPVQENDSEERKRR